MTGWLSNSLLPKPEKRSAYLREVSGAQTAAVGAAIRLRFDQVRDIGNAVRILKVEGASLDGREILDLFHTLAIAGEYRGILLSVADRYPRYGPACQEFGRSARSFPPLRTRLPSGRQLGRRS